MIELSIRNQKLKIECNNYIANKSNNYLKILFDFQTNDWQDKLKFCLIQVERKTYQFPINENKVVLPEYVLENKSFKISVYGANDDERITTNQIRIKIAESGYTTNISSEIPTKDIIVYILEELDKKLSIDDVDTILNDTSVNPIANCVVTNNLNNKSDIGHTHTASEVTGLNEVSEIEIKKAYRILTTKIRTYGE